VLFAVDHAVRAISHGRELVIQFGVDGRLVALVAVKGHTERGEELRVGDVLLLGADHAAADLELLLVGEVLGQQRHDAVVLAREQRLDRGQLRVLVGAHVAGDHGVLGVPRELSARLHRGRGARVAASAGDRQVAARQHQLRAGVGIAVIGASPQPVKTPRCAAVDHPGVDVGACGIDLLAQVRGTRIGSRRDGISRKRNRDDVVVIALEGVGCVERNGGVFGAALGQAEGVVEELSPHPGPLADVPLREQVDTERVEHPVRYAAGFGPFTIAPTPSA
jgi:hypothetical protein